MKPPGIHLALTEAPRTVFEFNAGSFNKLWLRNAPQGDGHSVVVIPGFLSSDSFNQRLVKFLNGLGYQADGWGMGRNLGPNHSLVSELEQKIRKLAEKKGEVSLIGHSLGGIYARELARSMPELVRQVISLGSPFGEGREEGSWASVLFNRINPQEELAIEERISREQLAKAPPVPTTAIYSKGDGVVNWRTAVQMQDQGHDQTQNIRVLGSHCGLTHNAAAWHLIADRLQYNKKTWLPFESRLFQHH